MEAIVGFWPATTQCATTTGQVLAVGFVPCTDIEDRKRVEEGLHQENVALREEVDKASMFEEIVGKSKNLLLC